LTQRYPLLWVDMQVSTRETEMATAFEELFDVRHYAGVTSLDSEIVRVRPAVVCFDFDFPTKPGLQMLQRTKTGHARIPLLMLTVQHSEALAVWAFRSRVWDYLVKPVAKRELERCFVGLREMLELQTVQRQGRVPAMVKSLIPDENRLSGPRGSSPLVLAPAIEYVERSYREKISSGEAAKLCSLTTFQLSRLFKETYGLTFQEFVLRFRIREACRLLRNPAAEIAEVAHLAGFNDPSYFGKIFRRYMHCSPSQFYTANQGMMDSDLLSDLALESLPPEP
jgi:YesN/AraC family two-component response regulator